MSPFIDRKKKFNSMRAHKLKVRAKIKKEGELINSMNQRGIDQYVKNPCSNPNEKPENRETNSR